MARTDVNRNDPCPCGSGKKYKHCCMDAPASGFDRKTTVALTIVGVAVAIAGVLYATVGRDAAGLVAGLGILIAGAWWLFTDPPSSKGSGDPGAISFGG